MRFPRLRRCRPLMVYFTILLAAYVVISFIFYTDHDSNTGAVKTLGEAHVQHHSSRTLLGRIENKGANFLARLKIQTGLSTTWCDTIAQTNNLPTIGQGCYLRNKLTCAGMPTLHSAFADMTSKQIVFVGVKLKNDTWQKEKYICEFSDDHITATDPIVDDGLSFGGQAQYVIIITCPIPKNIYTYLLRHKKTTISLRRSAEIRYAYENIPLCAFAERKKFLSMCTMVKGMDYLIPDWLVYYLYMGVEHVYIYDNSPESESTLAITLKTFVDIGYVTIIPWAHTYTPWKTYLEVQIAHENDCMWRHRHDSFWMIKVDVDEFIQPMNQSKPRIVDYLSNPAFSRLAGLRLRNWFFARPSNATAAEKNAPNVFERNIWRQPEPTLENRGRDKSIARPINIHHYKIHGVKLGGDTFSIDPYTEMRLVHYRTDNPRHPHFRIHQFLNDTSMVTQWKRIEKWFTSFQVAISRQIK